MNPWTETKLHLLGDISSPVKRRAGQVCLHAPVSQPAKELLASLLLRGDLGLFWKADPEKGYRKDARIILGV